MNINEFEIGDMLVLHVNNKHKDVDKKLCIVTGKKGGKGLFWLGNASESSDQWDGILDDEKYTVTHYKKDTELFKKMEQLLINYLTSQP